MVAKGVDKSWPELALYLHLTLEACQTIQAAFPTPNVRAGQMLANWRRDFTGDNPVEYLARALIEMGREDLAGQLGKSNILVTGL